MHDTHEVTGSTPVSPNGIPAKKRRYKPRVRWHDATEYVLNLARKCDTRVANHPPALVEVKGPLFELTEDDPAYVYFLMLDEKLLYVGQTRNIRSRIRAHIVTEKRIFNRVFYVLCPPELASHFESKYIRELKPEQNVRDSCYRPGKRAATDWRKATQSEMV